MPRPSEGAVVSNDWFKYERMRVLQDEYGRVVQANFAVIDCPKKNDRGGDCHSSKNITIPVNPRRRIETFKKTRAGWEVRIAKERNFNPLEGVDVDSLILGRLRASFIAIPTHSCRRSGIKDPTSSCGGCVTILPQPGAAGRR